MATRLTPKTKSMKQIKEVNQPTLEEKLRVVAEFADIHITPYKDYGSFIITYEDGDFDIEDVQFYSPSRDYNTLIDVWRKFRDTKLDPNTQRHHIKTLEKHRDKIATSIVFDPIETAFEQLYLGIQWLTTLKTTA